MYFYRYDLSATEKASALFSRSLSTGILFDDQILATPLSLAAFATAAATAGPTRSSNAFGIM